jgi:hypothetical protein
MYCYVCRKAGPDIGDKTEFVTEKKYKRESLVYQNKTSLKHEKCLNVVSEKPIPHLSILCLIQSINNYVQINTYWRYIVRIMASNIFLLASKICFLTSQGLVGAGMNCRVLKCDIHKRWWMHYQIKRNKAKKNPILN